MARLAIYNGSTLIREVELSDGTLRIGRSDQNDIVLFDPAKAVSRFHAEVRFEGGACTIADLNSQNGIWVAGRRVAHTTLAPGQAVLLGTYRLVLEAGVPEQEVPERTMVMSAAPEAPVVSAAKPAPVGAALPPSPVAPVPPSSSAPVPPLDTVRGEPAPPVHAVSKGVPQPPARAGRGHRILFVAAAAVCLAVIGVAGGIFWWPSSAGAPAASGRASDAPPPEDVLGGPPTEASAAPTTPGAPVVPAQDVPPLPAPTAASGRPADAPTTPVAVRLDGPAKPAGGAPAARPRRGAPLPTPRKEPAASPKPVPEPKAQVNTVQLIEQARLAVARGDHVAAAGLLDPVMQVDAGNPEALELLSSVRAEGSEAYKRGRQFDAVGRTSDALAMYDKVVKLLPADHPSARAAKERIAALR